MNALIWNTQRKNTLKCSKASMKKYQKRPTLGVRSGTVRLEGGEGEGRKEIGGREEDEEERERIRKK